MSIPDYDLDYSKSIYEREVGKFGRKIEEEDFNACIAENREIRESDGRMAYR